MSVHQFKDGTWYVKYWDSIEAKQRAKTFGKGEEGSTAHKAAIKYDKKIKAQKQLGSFNQHHVYYFDEIAQQYYEEKKKRRTLKDYDRYFINTINNEILPLIEDIPASNLTRQQLLDIESSLYSQNNKSRATVQRYMGYMKHIFNYGVETEMISKNPLAFWKKKKEERYNVMLTYSDLKKIYDVSPPHVQWAIEVALNLVIRVGESELFAIKWANINWDTKEVRCLMPKTNRWKTVPCTDRFMGKLREHRDLAETEYLIEYRGNPLKSIKTAWKTAVKNAGIPYRTRPYDIRHIAISIMANYAPIAVVSSFAGHSSTDMTLSTYYHATIEHQRQALECIPDIAC